MEKGKDSLWVHVASVGEFNTIRPILKRLFPRYQIILTYFSHRAKEYLSLQKDKGYFHELHRLPIDLPPFVKVFENKIKPKAILIMERELWPSLLSFTKAPKIWLNAYSKGGLLEKWLSKRFSLIVTKDKISADRFLSYGCKRVIFCGNLKFVLEDPPKVELRVEASKLIIAGSTHEGEEILIKKAFDKLREHFKDLKLLIAPRHISRSREVAEIFGGYRVSFRSNELPEWDVLVVDKLGELFSLYTYGTVAFVGGTLIPIGGHNLLEPAYFGKPVLYGPYTHKVRDLREFLEERGLGFEVKDEKDLYVKLYAILSGEIKSIPFDFKDYAKGLLECYLSAIDEALLLEKGVKDIG